MKNKAISKVLAVMLCVTMALGTCVTAFAAAPSALTVTVDSETGKVTLAGSVSGTITYYFCDTKIDPTGWDTSTTTNENKAGLEGAGGPLNGITGTTTGRDLTSNDNGKYLLVCVYGDTNDNLVSAGVTANAIAMAEEVEIKDGDNNSSASVAPGTTTTLNLTASLKEGYTLTSATYSWSVVDTDSILTFTNGGAKTQSVTVKDTATAGQTATVKLAATSGSTTYTGHYEIVVADSRSGSVTSTGRFESHLEKSELLVELPTSNAGDFEYIADPELLIAATSAARYTGKTFEDKTITGVYFQTEADKYSSNSKKLTVTNKGSEDADVTLKAKATGGTNVNLVATSDAVNDEANKNKANLFLGLVVGTDAAVDLTATESDCTVSKGLKGIPANFHVTWSASDNEYQYTQKAQTVEDWQSFDFYMTGAAGGDWSADGVAAPSITVTWSYDKRADNSTAPMITADAAPSIAKLTYSVSTDKKAGDTMDITLSLGGGKLAATDIASVDYVDNSGTYPQTKGTEYTYTAGDTTLHLTKALVDYLGDGIKLIITFNDTANNNEGTKVTLSFTA